jgi:hypothetical protein
MLVWLSSHWKSELGIWSSKSSFSISLFDFYHLHWKIPRLHSHWKKRLVVRLPPYRCCCSPQPTLFRRPRPCKIKASSWRVVLRRIALVISSKLEDLAKLCLLMCHVLCKCVAPWDGRYKVFFFFIFIINGEVGVCLNMVEDLISTIFGRKKETSCFWILQFRYYLVLRVEQMLESLEVVIFQNSV